MKYFTTLVCSISFAAYAAADIAPYPLRLSMVRGVNYTTYGNMNVTQAVQLASGLMGANGINTNQPATTTSTTIDTTSGSWATETLDISLSATGNWNTQTQANFLLNSILSMATATANITTTPYMPGSAPFVYSYMNIYQGPSYFTAQLADNNGGQVAWLKLAFDNTVEVPNMDGCDAGAESIVTDALWDFLVPFGGLPLGGLIAAFATFGCDLADGSL